MPELNHENKPLYPYRFGLSFGFFDGMTWMIVSATPMILFLQKLGGTTFQVGLAYSFAYLMLPLQVIATALIPRLGYKKQVISSWSVRTLFLLVPLWIAYSRPLVIEPWMPSIMVWSFFLFCFFRSVGYSALYPWLYALLPIKLRGRYFATDQSFLNLAGVLALAVSSFLFYAVSEYTAFGVIYIIGIISSLLAIYSLARLNSKDSPSHINLKEVFHVSPKLCLRPGPFRYYLVVSMIWYLVGIPYIPFVIFYLNSALDIPDGQIVMYTAIQYFGSITVGWVMRPLLDRIRTSKFFVVSMLSCIGVKVYWLFMLLGYINSIDTIWLIFLINGASIILWQAAHFKYMPQLCSKKDRALGVALQTAVVGVMGGIAPMLWGLILQGEVTGRNIDISAFIAYFVVAIVVMSALVPALVKLPEASVVEPVIQES